jgi:hypothetical protein
MIASQIASDYLMFGSVITGIILLLSNKNKFTPLEIILLIIFYPIVFHYIIRYLNTRKND